MSSAQAPPPASAAPAKPPSGLVAALEYTGVPKSWLSKRPRLPSRNWMIFISVVSSITYLYVDDRRQCKAIRQEYIDKVKHLSEEKLDSLDMPRKIKVFACKWPGDDEYDRSMKYFKKYVKPIFVAAAVDYELHNGNQHGALAHLLANKIKERRREEAGIATPSTSMALPGHPQSPEQVRRKELEGGTVIVGRHTFKEYMLGLRRGWTEDLAIVDEERELAKALEDDGVFDEPELPETMHADLGESDAPAPALNTQPSPIIFSPLQQMRQSAPLPPRTPAQTSSPPPFAAPVPPPDAIPTQPPILLVPFVNRLGFFNVPMMIVDFFNERRKVREGAKAAYALVISQTRDMHGSSLNVPLELQSADATDLDFDVENERYFRSSYAKRPEEIAKARANYYKELPAKITIARELARGVREPTKDETAHPPPTEVELRAERMKKEKRWREDEEAWKFLKAGERVVWDERFDGKLSLFVDPVGLGVGNLEMGDKV
ncbi:hypothetical protein BOTBODRAFT_136638 [Botryobasidium botryosum FD-172 SS1]|uniref:Mitochondrial import inner membrane translocase subunit TIM54 n=1 Tax=Botryobasidium botryosum (strain FD-172 SS1) TaxID=930990 RepID=A0A067M440_BOTB1|nr:hypothetical protein BOTBODRAFT_136638 [Botryobasidium botryosum FD-172 SS1]